MGKKRSHSAHAKRIATRRTPQARPHGILEVAADGFGFVSTAEGEFFISASKMGGAFDGDLVEIAPIKQGKSGSALKKASSAENVRGVQRPAARVLRVLDRAHDSIIGRYEVADPFGVVVPQDTRIPYDIFTMRADNPTIPHGAIVRVRMVEYPSRNTAATGVIEEVLGMDGAPGMDVEAIIARHKLETRFSEAALAQAAEAVVDVEGALAEGYVDERDRFVFTIDPFDARDFDDALSVEELECIPSEGACAARPTGSCASAPHCIEQNASRLEELGVSKPSDGIHSSSSTPGEFSKRWRVGVHIADVSHYVPWGSSVDLDARRRAMSVYLVDRVLPMLPEALSNDICSLIPGQPRRAFTVDVVVDETGKVYSADFHLGIIESKARLSYDQAQCYVDARLRGQSVHDAIAEFESQPVPPRALPLDTVAHAAMFEALGFLNRFAHARAKMREAAGGIDFETAEAKVQLDDDNNPIDVVLRTRTAATSCVEEAMILANECVAHRLRDTHTPGIFRVHDAPVADSLAALVPVLQEFGYDKYVDLAAFVAGNPQTLQAVLARAKGRTEASLISNLLLRAQQRAVYRASCSGHYGLASEAYLHFTSPIRRYPDLVVHRMLRTLVQGKTESFTAEVDALDWLAEHSSKMERIAEAAARESQEMKLVEYMQQFVGQEFDGIVSGVATYGLYVQLENTAEGLLATRDLGNEYFSFDSAAHKLIGQDTGQSFRLGQRIRVRIAPSQPHARKLDLK